jgi:thioredoxin 1
MIIVKKFYATWCQPCKVLNPAIESLKGEFKQVTFVDINIEESPSEVSKYGVVSVPTVIVEKEGEIKSRFTGLQPRTAFSNAIKQLL